MSNYSCGPCCFKKRLNKKERIEMAAAVNEIFSANKSINLLCPDCDKELFVIDGVITTKIPYEGYSQEDEPQDRDVFNLTEKDSVQIDFFEIMRFEKND